MADNGLALMRATGESALREYAEQIRPSINVECEGSIRLLVATLAVGQVGESDPRKYWLDAYGKVPTKGYSWCGIFALSMYRLAKLTDIHWCVGAPFYGYIAKLSLPQTDSPKVGDTAYFTKNQHHALVIRADEKSVLLCQGNGAGGKVTITTSLRSSVTAFFSIYKLINERVNR